MPRSGGAPARLWDIVGGREQGGILVREGPELNSPALAERLSTGARVKQLGDLLGERLYFRLVTGEGPQSGWISTHLRHKPLAVPVEPEPVPAQVRPALAVRAPAQAAKATRSRQNAEPERTHEAEKVEASSGPPLRYFDLVRGPVEREKLTYPLEGLAAAAPCMDGLPDVLRAYGVGGFKVESILRTELGRDKYFVRARGEDGQEEHLFVGHYPSGSGPASHTIEASIEAFQQIGERCRPERASVAKFRRTRSGNFLHNRHVLAPEYGPSDWGRGTNDRFMLAVAIGELHRASVAAFGAGLPPQLERDLVQDEVGLDVLNWGLLVDYSQSGLSDGEVGRIRFIISALQGLDRPERIAALPKIVVHPDLQFKNWCRASDARGPVLVDCKLGHYASRIWALYFVLCGDDLCTLLPRDKQGVKDFVDAVHCYEEVSGMPFDDEERFLLMNAIMVKAIFNTCFFGKFNAQLAHSKKKCRAAFEAMEWIIERKDYFRSVF